MSKEIDIHCDYYTYVNTCKKNRKTKSIKKNPIKIVKDNKLTLILEWIENKYQITAGRKEALFDRLIKEDDQDYLDTFLMNHTSFISSLDLLNQLSRVFCTPIYQSRVLYIIHYWLNTFYYQFEENQQLFIQLNSFLTASIPLQQQQQQQPRLCLEPHIVAHVNNRSILSIESKNIARYLSLVDYHLFNYVLSNELVHYGDGNNKCIELMTNRFNMVCTIDGCIY